MAHSLLLSMFFPFETAHMLNRFISSKWHEVSRYHLVCTVNVRAFTQCRKERDGETHDSFLHKQLLERLRKITSQYTSHTWFMLNQYLMGKHRWRNMKIKIASKWRY